MSRKQHRHLALLGSTALVAIISFAALSALLLTGSSAPAWAGSGGMGGNNNGGNGGAGNGGGGGGGTGSPGAGNSNGLTSINGDGGDGGHSNYGALGAGGAGGTVGATTFGGVSVTGGIGHEGIPDPSPSYAAGGGGGGGDGVYTTGTALSIGAGISITGGAGGKGGSGDRINGGGGGGGAGLSTASSGVVINNAGTLLGGAGGQGGDSGQFGGGGGGGGDGLRILGGSSLLTNTGSIIGGNGGAGGVGQFTGGAGEGGAGISVAGDGNTIINSGTISGGLAGDLSTRANAVVLDGANNILELRAGSTIIGNMVANGSGNTLVLGGDTTNATTVLDASTYNGFASYRKSGASTWMLTGSNSSTTPWELASGVLSVGSDASLGASTGTLTFNGGTLQVTGTSFTSANRAITWGMGGGGFDIVEAGNAFTVSQQLTGSGGLTKLGAGTLVLTGSNSYAGGTLVGAGTLMIGNGGTSGSITGDVVNNGALVFNRSDDLAFGGAVSGSGGLTKLGAGTLILTGNSSYVGGTSLDAGALAIGSSSALGTGTLAMANGTALLFAADGLTLSNAITLSGDPTFTVNGSDTARVDGVIADGTLPGDLVKAGTGTLTLNGQSTYTGATMVEAGKLVVGDDSHASASLASIVTVNNGGTLGGIGTVGGLVVNGGGTVTPGNSIGTLHVAGNVSFAAGSFYQVEINPAGDSDRIAATGTATLSGGTVDVTKAPGSYLPGTSYTILTASGGVTGTFANLTQNLPFIDLSLGYDPGNVYLDIVRNQTSFPSVGITRNQIASGTAVEALGQGNVLYGAVVQQTNEWSARTAFDALSGEIHASVAGAFVEDSRFVREAVTNRTRQATAEGAGPLPPILAYAPGQTAKRLPGSDLALWGQAFGSWSEHDSDGNAASLSRRIGGFVVGVDMPLGSVGRLGFAGGYSRSSFDVNGRLSKATSDDYHLSLYGGTQFGALGLRFGAAYTWHELDTSRTVAFPGFSDSATAGYQARTAQVFGEAGYQIGFGPVALEPFANLAYVNLDSDAFQERGGVSVLGGRAANLSATYTTLGLRAATSFTLIGSTVLTARGTLGWRHAFGDVGPEAVLAFTGGSPFSVAGVPIARDALVMEAGLDIPVAKDMTLGVSYSGQIAKDATDNGVRGNFTWRF